MAKSRHSTSLFEHKETPLLADTPSITYIWIGSPPDAKHADTSVPGHDVAAPKRMAAFAKHIPIQFFCLEEQYIHYVKQFKTFKNVSVHAVETFLRQCIKTYFKQATFFSPPDFTYEYAVKILQAMEKLLVPKEERVERSQSIRDLVTIKVMMAYFLLAIKGGYFMDTNINVIDDQIEHFTLPKFKTFCAPLLEDGLKYDCWLMYAPPEDRVAKSILENYFKRYDEIGHSFKHGSGDYPEAYHLQLGEAIIKPIMESVPYDTLPTEWRVSRSNTNLLIRQKTYFLDMLNLSKVYFNSHVYQQKTTLKRQVLQTFLDDNLQNLQVMFDGGLKIDAEFEGFPLIAHALSLQATKCMDFMIKQGVKITEQIVGLAALLLFGPGISNACISTEKLNHFKYLMETYHFSLDLVVNDKSLLHHLLKSEESLIIDWLHQEKIVIFTEEMLADTIFELTEEGIKVKASVLEQQVLESMDEELMEEMRRIFAGKK